MCETTEIVSCSVKSQMDFTERDRVQAIERSAQNLIANFGRTPDDHCIWNIAQSVWPALGLPEYQNDSISEILLHLIPLQRLGQMEGKSGSLVLIGYLSDARDISKPRSNPVVIKTQRADESRDKLREEFENALSIKSFVNDQKDSFAIPIFFDDKVGPYRVLWSIYSPHKPFGAVGSGTDSPDALQVKDLRESLINGEDDRAELVLVKAIKLVQRLHDRFNKSIFENRSYFEEYQRYLRGIDEGDWGDEWRSTWGDQATREIEDAGGKFVNPFWLIEQIRGIERPMKIGAVHGDLHAGNVVLADDQPRIIDFGWAKDCSHIAKDFVLMECNLRFHTFRPQINQREVYALADWFRVDEPTPEGLGEYTNRRVQLILTLREIAKKSLATEDREPDWNWEYLVPLFLVAFGLLRYSKQLGNQQSAVRFVLALATYIETILPKD